MAVEQQLSVRGQLTGPDPEREIECQSCTRVGLRPAIDVGEASSLLKPAPGLPSRSAIAMAVSDRCVEPEQRRFVVAEA